jgi:hypothetical protein
MSFEIEYTYHLDEDRPHRYRVGNYVGVGRSRAEAKVDLRDKIQNAGMVET